MKKAITIIVLLALSALSAYHAIRAREIRDRELGRLERFHGRDSSTFQLRSRWMGGSYVFSFRLVGSVGAIVWLAAAIYVAIHE